MARDGLSGEDCKEILADFRRECPHVSDDLLVWLAGTFALEAPVDFDQNDAIFLLHQPGRKVSLKQTFSQNVLPEAALQAFLARLDGERGIDESYSGGLLTLRANCAQIKRFWPDSINEMMIQLREAVGPRSEAIFGVFRDELINDESELFVLLSISSAAPPGEQGR